MDSNNLATVRPSNQLLLLKQNLPWAPNMRRKSKEKLLGLQSAEGITELPYSAWGEQACQDPCSILREDVSSGPSWAPSLHRPRA